MMLSPFPCACWTSVYFCGEVPFKNPLLTICLYCLTDCYCSGRLHYILEIKLLLDICCTNILYHSEDFALKSFFFYLCVWGYIHMTAGTHGVQKGVVRWRSCYRWSGGGKWSQFSTREAWAFDCWAISPALILSFWWNCF